MLILHGLSVLSQFGCAPLEHFPALHQNGSLWVCDHIRTVHLHQIWFEPEAGLTGTGAADHQHIFVSGGLWVLASGFNQQEYDADAADKMVADAGYDDTIDDVEQAIDKDGNALGYVITVTAKDGSQGSITFSVGIKNDGTVNGYSITDISETPGLGMKAEEEDFYSQFENKTVDKFTVVKQKPASDDQIEAITGSTITSKAMANGCNAAIYYFQNALGGAQ